MRALDLFKKADLVDYLKPTLIGGGLGAGALGLGSLLQNKKEESPEVKRKRLINNLITGFGLGGMAGAGYHGVRELMGNTPITSTPPISTTPAPISTPSVDLPIPESTPNSVEASPVVPPSVIPPQQTGPEGTDVLGLGATGAGAAFGGVAGFKAGDKLNTALENTGLSGLVGPDINEGNINKILQSAGSDPRKAFEKLRQSTDYQASENPALLEMRLLERLVKGNPNREQVRDIAGNLGAEARTSLMKTLGYDPYTISQVPPAGAFDFYNPDTMIAPNPTELLMAKLKRGTINYGSSPTDKAILRDLITTTPSPSGRTLTPDEVTAELTKNLAGGRKQGFGETYTKNPLTGETVMPRRMLGGTLRGGSGLASLFFGGYLGNKLINLLEERGREAYNPNGK